MKFLKYFYFYGSFLPSWIRIWIPNTDPDPLTQLDPDPIRIRIRNPAANTVKLEQNEKLRQNTYWCCESPDSNPQKCPNGPQSPKKNSLLEKLPSQSEIFNHISVICQISLSQRSKSQAIVPGIGL
jgi:hypothetical protein